MSTTIDNPLKFFTSYIKGSEMDSLWHRYNNSFDSYIGYPEYASFDAYLDSVLLSECGKFYQAIDSAILNLPIADAKKLLKQISNNLKNLSAFAEKIPEHLKTDLYNILNQMENHLKDKKLTESGNKSSGNSFAPKLKWNGPANLLVTLFYDLTIEKVISRNPEKKNLNLLIADHDIIINLIVTNFCDSDDHDFNPETLRRYLNPDRHAPEKRRIKVRKYSKTDDSI